MTDSAGLAVLPDLHLAESGGLPLIRRQIAPPVGATRRVPLIPGTERFAGPWLPIWHGEDIGWLTHDLAVYSALDARISGDGWIWLDNRLVTSPDVMPLYVRERLQISADGHQELHRASSLPVRSIETPCLVAVGHGARVYGHFLIELLFRVLLARKAFGETGLRCRILLDRASPAWLLRILTEDLKVSPDEVEFFDPAVEQVRLRHAILPTLVLRLEVVASRVLRWGAGFHLMANDMLAAMVAGLDLDEIAPTPKRIFVARRGFSNAASAYRRCLNEEQLIAIASRRHGFSPVTMEELTWRQQIAAFRNAEIVLGLAGSGLHNALFSVPGSALASIGVSNVVQSEIGHLRRQHNAFLDGIPMSGDFAVDETHFTAFLDAVCENWPLPQPGPVR